MTDQANRANSQTRVFEFDLEGRASDGGIPVVVSSDAVVEVSDGPEVLVHSDGSIDMQRAPLPIIATHQGGQVNVGLIDELTVTGGKLRGMARFGSRPEAAGYRDDVAAGIIRSVSVGYARIKAHYRDDGVLVTTRWMPSHAALVAEPADINAGFYRAISAPPALVIEPAPEINPPAAPAAPPKESTVDQTNEAAGQAAETQTERATAPAQARQGPSAKDIEAGRQRAIRNLCAANKIEDKVRDHWVSSGLSIDEITDDLLSIIESRGKTNPQSAAKLGLTSEETQRFSLFRAIAAARDNNWSQAGFELECSRAVAKALGKDVVEPTRFFVPFEVQEREVYVPANRTGRRDMTAASSSAGGYLVATQNTSFIEILRNRAVSFRMGARRLPGLRDSVTIPRQSGAATAVWMTSESATITESAQTLGQLSLTPKTVGAYTEISRQLMLQSSPAIEGIVTADLAAVTALAVDVAVLRGSGSSGEPTGIVNTAGIGSVTGSSLAFDDILEFQTDVATANVMPVSGGYVTTPSVASLCIQRVKYSNTASPLWEGNVWDGSMQGFPAMASNQMSSATMLFGDWSQVLVGEWGVLEIDVNPYASFQSAITGVRAIYTMDCGLRYAGAFSYASSIT